MGTLDPDWMMRHLDLEPLGFEGGFFRETYRSSSRRLGGGADSEGSESRDLGTAIYYMLTAQSRSMLHRLQSDEIYHFYLGDPVELFLIHPGGRGEVLTLGPDIPNGHRVQQLVPAHTWQGSRLAAGGVCALMGTTMTPGFELTDFELGRRSVLLSKYPDYETRIVSLTPEVLETPKLELTAATRDLVHAQARGLQPLLKGLSASGAPDWPLPHVDEEAVRFLRERLDAGPEEAGWWSWYVVRAADRALVGVVGYHGPPNAEGEVELGYSVGARARGRGVATEAAGALVGRAFLDPRVQCVRIRSEGTDQAALRVAEKLGFVREPHDDPAIASLVKAR